MLMAQAYGAAGQATSALHAMTLLQVYQAKALKELHKGSSDPGLMQELRTATDFTLRVTKVTVRSLGQTTDTLVVQERHLWLSFAQQFLAAQKQMEAIKHILARRPSAAFTPPLAAAALPACRQGCSPEASSAPAQPQQQHPPKPQWGAGHRGAALPIQAPAKPGGKRKCKRL